MPRLDWSATRLVEFLKRDQPKLFASIHKGTVSKWLDPINRRAWSEATLANIQRHHALPGSGRVGALARYPAVTEEIASSLRALRTSGVPVSHFTGRSLMLAILEERCPEILKMFHCSESFVRAFFESKMNWTPRKGTRGAGHIPPDADVLCERAFFRIVYVMQWEQVPAKLVINMDQIGVVLVPAGSCTFHDRGAKQVDVVGKDEKRAVSVLVASAMDGQFLPFQEVVAGSTPGVLPHESLPRMADARKYGFDFAFAASKKKNSHYSTLKTMKEWVKNILDPYVRRTIAEDPTLDPDQMSICYIDCYPVHTSDLFRVFVFREFPNIVLIFVPANCTGLLQPADVGLNHIIKHRIRQVQLRCMVQEHHKQLANSIAPQDIQFSTSLPVLRDATVEALVDVYEFMTSPKGCEVVRKAWKNCTVKEWDLSEECVTSRKARNALKDYLKRDSILREEIENRMGTVSGLEEPLEPGMHTEDDCDVSEDLTSADHDDDDTDIPLQAVVRETLDLAVEGPKELHCVHKVKQSASGALCAAEAGEDVWAYDENGDVYDATNLPELEQE